MNSQVSIAAPAKPRFPLTISAGDVEATIYRTPTKIRGTKYDTFTLCWHLNGKRQRRRFSDLDQARAEGDRVVREKSQGALAVAAISAQDRISLEAALVELAKAEGTSKATPSRLIELVKEYASARALLPMGVTLSTAAQFFAQRHPANAPRKTVAEVAAEFIADRASAGCSAIHLRDLRIRLQQQFAATFQMPITATTGPLVQSFIYNLKNQKTGQPSANRSKENMLRCIASLYGFARRMKYVPTDLALEITEIPTPKKQPKPIGIYAPSDLVRILAAADADILPALAIAAFAGLRLAEVSRLDWKDIRLGERLLIVEADKAKTAARRVVPVCDALFAWLAPHAEPAGPISPCEEDLHNVGNALGNRFERTVARAKVKWVRNGFRHSYISYRTSTLKDVPAVALEAGNSPTVIFSSYRALATEAEGQAWFAVRPPQPASNIVQIPAAAAA